MDENYSNPLVASPSIVYPPSPSAPSSLAVRPATSKPPPRRARAAHLHDGELPRSPPPFSLVPFACDDAAAALNIAARPVPPTTLSARRVSRVSRVSLARARAGMKQSPNGGPVGLSRDDGLAPPARALATVDDGEREREREISRFVPRAPRSLARSPRSRAPASRLALPPPGRMAVLSGHRRGHIDESQTVIRPNSWTDRPTDRPTDRWARIF